LRTANVVSALEVFLRGFVLTLGTEHFADFE